MIFTFEEQTGTNKLVFRQTDVVCYCQSNTMNPKYQ